MKIPQILKNTDTDKLPVSFKWCRQFVFPLSFQNPVRLSTCGLLFVFPQKRSGIFLSEMSVLYMF